MQLHRIALALAVTTFLTACLDDPDEPMLDEAVEELAVVEMVPSGFYLPATPAVFRGADYRLQVVGTNAAGYVAMDIQREPNVWGPPNPTLVSTPVGARHVAAAQDAWGRTVVFATFGTWLLRTQETQPYSRVFNNWIYVDTSILERKPSLAVNQDGRLEVAYVGSNGRVKTIWQTAPAGGWSAPYDTGLTTSGTPVLMRDRQARLELFVPRTTLPCGLTYTRQRGINGTGGWFPPTTTSTACATHLTVAYSPLGNDDSTDVLAYSAAGGFRHLTRAGSDLLFQPGPLQAGADAPPTLIAKDDGTVLAVYGFLNCQNGDPPGSPGCGVYVSALRRYGAWVSWAVFNGVSRTVATVGGADSLINNTYLFAPSNSTNQYDRMFVR